MEIIAPQLMRLPPMGALTNGVVGMTPKISVGSLSDARSPLPVLMNARCVCRAAILIGNATRFRYWLLKLTMMLLSKKLCLLLS